MELKYRIIRNLEWSNKRLKLIGKGLDEKQMEIIEFSLLHDLLQLTLTDVVKSDSEQLLFSADEIVSKINEQTVLDGETFRVYFCEK